MEPDGVLGTPREPNRILMAELLQVLPLDSAKLHRVLPSFSEFRVFRRVPSGSSEFSSALRRPTEHSGFSRIAVGAKSRGLGAHLEGSKPELKAGSLASAEPSILLSRGRCLPLLFPTPETGCINFSIRIAWIFPICLLVEGAKGVREFFHEACVRLA